MRLNKFIAHHTQYSRREADELIGRGRITVNGELAVMGQRVETTDAVAINGTSVTPQDYIYLKLNKPVGYVCSRSGQQAPTVYELLPDKYRNLNTVGRLDKDSSGLILLTNDGEFAHQYTHPSFVKNKIYHVRLASQLTPVDEGQITSGVDLDDGRSQLQLQALDDTRQRWQAGLHEGRNRQIRRTFEAVGNQVVELHRLQVGPYNLGGLKPGQFQEIEVIND